MRNFMQVNYLIVVSQDANGAVMILEQGEIPLDYRHAEDLHAALTVYLSLGAEAIEKARYDAVESMNSWKRTPAPPKAEPKPGYIYLVASSNGTYNIGRTAAPDKRMQLFRVKLPFDVELECVIKTSDMLGLERELHKRFADKRVNGEWFALSPEDVEYIKSLVAKE